MFFISNLCILCLHTYKDLKTILIKDNQAITIQKKLKYCVPEIVDTHLEIPEYMCSECMCKIDYFYKFKQSCLRNKTHLQNYLQTLICSGETHKHLSVKLSDIKYQNNPQVDSHCHKLPIVDDDDEIRTGENENNWTFEEADAVVENEIKHADLIDTEEAHSLSDDVKDIIVKEECLAFEDNGDIEFHHEFVKFESFTSDSDTSFCDNEDVEQIKDTKRFQCDFCGKNYSNKILLEYHLKVHAAIQEYCCSDCGIQFRSEYELINHEKIHTDIANDYSTPENKQKSSTNASNENISNQLKEINPTIQNKKNKFQCTICDKEFTNKRSLIYHLKLHAGIKDFCCTKCDKKFRDKRQLSYHERHHTGIKNFECAICKNRFLHQWQARQHEKSHLGIKKHECSICNQKFARKSHLLQHAHVHTGTKNYQCTVCNKKFSRQSNCKKHEQIHTEIKKFESTICKKKIFRRDQLTELAKFHQDEH